MAVLALSLLGHAAGLVGHRHQRHASSDPYLTKQLLNVAIGLVLMAGVSMLDYRQLRLYSPVVLVLSCLGLAGRADAAGQHRERRQIVDLAARRVPDRAV